MVLKGRERQNPEKLQIGVILPLDSGFGRTLNTPALPTPLGCIPNTVQKFNYTDDLEHFPRQCTMMSVYSEINRKKHI
jgi:hypothetical protein